MRGNSTKAYVCQHACAPARKRMYKNMGVQHVQMYVYACPTVAHKFMYICMSACVCNGINIYVQVYVCVQERPRVYMYLCNNSGVTYHLREIMRVYRHEKVCTNICVQQKESVHVNIYVCKAHIYM